MPKYNKMLEEYDKLDFIGEKETHIRSENENGSSTGGTTNDNRYSQLPQNEIEDVRDGTYLTDYTYNTGTSTGTANRNTTENIVITRADDLDEYKKFLDYANNVYEDIFKECDSLFFSIV